MRKKIMITAIAIIGIIILFWLSGGGVLLVGLDMLFAHNKDVTQKEEYWGGYESEQRYELLMDVFLERVKDWSDRSVLTPPGQLPQCAGLYSAPNSITEYQEKPKDWPEVVGIVKAGTQLKCKMLRKHGTLMWGSSITTFAEILDGPYKGQIVDIEDLSVMIDREYRGCILNKPDPRILRELTETVNGNNITDVNKSEAIKLARREFEKNVTKDVAHRYCVKDITFSDGAWSVLFTDPNSGVLGDHYFVIVNEDKTVQVLPGE